MIVYPLFGGVTSYYANANNPQPLQSLVIGQDALMPLSVGFPQVGGGLADMSNGWTIEVALLGGTGVEEGIEGTSVYAAYTGPGGFTYNAGTMLFTGIIDTRGPLVAALIGAASNHNTKLAVKATQTLGGLVVQTFQVKIACDVEAPVIQSGLGSSAGSGPVPFTVMAGQSQATFIFPNLALTQDLDFVKLGPGSSVDWYTINIDGDDPTQNSVTVNLYGVAPVGGINFRCYIKRA
jgi:hypothetical protein